MASVVFRLVLAFKATKVCQNAILVCFARPGIVCDARRTVLPKFYRFQMMLYWNFAGTVPTVQASDESAWFLQLERLISMFWALSDQPFGCVRVCVSEFESTPHPRV